MKRGQGGSSKAVMLCGGIFALGKTDLSDILANYDIGRILHTRVLSGGLFLSPLLIETSRGSYVLRGHSFRTAAGFGAQAEIVSAVADLGIRCPRVLRTCNEEWSVPRNSTLYALHEYLPGQVYGWQEWQDAKKDPRFVQNLGASIARLHDTLRLTGKPAPVLDPSLPPVQFNAIEAAREQWNRDFQMLSDNLAARAIRQSLSAIDEIWDYVHESTERLGAAVFARQTLHGDISPVNLVFEDSEPGFIDWDFMHSGSRLYDALGDVLNRPPITGPCEPEWDVIERYLESYDRSSTQPLTAEERGCVNLFLVTRQLEDLRQRVYTLRSLPPERHAEYAAIASIRIRTAMRMIHEQRI